MKIKKIIYFLKFFDRKKKKKYQAVRAAWSFSGRSRHKFSLYIFYYINACLSRLLAVLRFNVSKWTKTKKNDWKKKLFQAVRAMLFFAGRSRHKFSLHNYCYINDCCM